jgi:hypothetical protein
MTRILLERIVNTTARSLLPYVFPNAAYRISGSPCKLRPMIRGLLKKISSASRSVTPCFFSEDHGFLDEVFRSEWEIVR